jgi:hypothetical protein
MQFAAYTINWRLLRMINIRARLAGHVHESHTSLVQSKYGVIDEGVITWNEHVHVNHRGATRRHRHCLDKPAGRRHQVTITVDLFEYSTNHVKC